LLLLLLLLLLLQEASVRGQLYMDTFQRLNLGLVLQSGTCLVVLAQAISLRNPLLTGEQLEKQNWLQLLETHVKLLVVTFVISVIQSGSSPMLTGET
jgi:ABC-type iron transport system FetAB permease component